MVDTTMSSVRARRPLLLPPDDAVDPREVGGKAASLSALATAAITDCDVPPWFVVMPAAVAHESELALAISRALQAIAPNGELVAVRSSAVGEDGSADSYAGQLESHLNVEHWDVAARIRDVWRSAASARVSAYEAARGLSAQGRTAVIVQRMVDADAAGVAFSADPASGRRGIAVVAAVRGTADGLVQGAVDADEWKVDRSGRVVAQPATDCAPVLTTDDVLRIAGAARAAARHFGVPQDIEWALKDGRLSLLQSRPITSLRQLPDPDGALALWDNSNIVESYGGVTTPLTYSFARYAYEQVYRQFLLLLGVTAETVDANAGALRRMIGLVRGRVYYNLASWYRALALLPGYGLNRGFMEQMMGVRDGVPDEFAILPSRTGVRAALDLVRAARGLVREHGRIERSIRLFHTRVDEALSSPNVPLEDMRADELTAHYRSLEAALLARWDAPLLNDFFAMIHFGVLRTLARKWCGDTEGTLPNDLIAGEGGMVSAEPVRRIGRMADLAAERPHIVAALREGSVSEALAAMAEHPSLLREYTAYLSRFGDRCAEELKLETRTLSEEPLPLLRSIGHAASSTKAQPASPTANVRHEAEARAWLAMRGHPMRRWIFRAVMKRARARIRDRENLRFERTRVFGRVRRIIVELGKRLAAQGLLDDARDVFHLEINEVLGVVEGTATTISLDEIAAARRREYDVYRAEAAPAERFETRGMVHQGNHFRGAEPRLTGIDVSIEAKLGTGCYPGIVRGVARVVTDPRRASLRQGEILVAERTDPGWIMLFPGAAGLLVERGSLLSHSAIVSRELGIPSAIAIQGLTNWLHTGDVVELDGRSGAVRLITRATVSETESGDDE